MVDISAVLARVCISQLESKYFRRIVADMAQSSLSGLTYLAFVKVALKNRKVLVDLTCLMAVVDVE